MKTKSSITNARTVSTNGQRDYVAILEEAWYQHLAPRQNDAPTVISTFAGCGGSSLGYSMAGFRELLAVEWDQNAVDTFRLNFPEVPVYHGDIAKLSVQEVFELTGLKEGELDVFDGSPPCQGFSTAGKREMSDSRNQLFREYVRLLRGLKPKVFVMENVSGMVKGKMKLIFAEILRELKASGYKVKAVLMNAMYFNVPQSRQRMIFIGVRDDLRIEPSHPKAMANVISLRTIAPDAIGCKSQQINPWIPSSRPYCTIQKAGFLRETIRTARGQREPTGQELRLFGSFPLPFQFIGKFEQEWERIGNSVPPLFMRAISKHIKEEILNKITARFNPAPALNRQTTDEM